MWDWEDRLTTYSYDHAGRVLGVQRPNGVDTDYDYDVAGRLVAIEHAKGEEWLTRFDYELDLEGNRVAVTETTTALGEYELPLLGREGTAGAEETGSALPVGEVIHYSYDQGDRLTGASYGNGDRYEYAYDLAGNRTTLTVTTQGLVTETTSYSYDNADRLTSVGGMPIAYDNRGNQLGDGVWSYSYNPAGRMVRAETITSTHVYTYSGDGLLVAQSLDGAETAITWDLALALPQVLATSNGLRALYGLERLAVVQGGEWYYPQHDAIGSVRQWTDAAGAVVGLQGYTPYGESLVPVGPPVAPWGFTGEWEDPAGLVYLRARWYNPPLGRFTQVDPWPGNVERPATRHPYAYGLDDPVLNADPSGRLAIVVVAGVTVIVVVVAVVGYWYWHRTYAPGVEAPSVCAPRLQLNDEARARIVRLLPLEVQFLLGVSVVLSWEAAGVLQAARYTGDPRTAGEIIGQEKQGRITREFPSEMLGKTYDEIKRLADQGNKAAKTAKKLLDRKEYDKKGKR